MNKVEVLIQGYADVNDKGWDATSSTILITTDDGKKVIVDPGCNPDLLMQKLNEKNLKVDDIDFVFLTHHHIDHALNAGLFTKSKIVDFEAVYDKNIGVYGSNHIPETDIEIILTPGHEDGHASLAIPTDDGIVVASGDVFWWEVNEEQKVDVNKPDDFADDLSILRESREKLLKVGKWIIPGHGKMFEITQIN